MLHFRTVAITVLHFLRTVASKFAGLQIDCQSDDFYLVSVKANAFSRQAVLHGIVGFIILEYLYLIANSSIIAVVVTSG